MPASIQRTALAGPEWPTWLVAVAIHAGWLALTFLHTMLPTSTIVVTGAWLIAWHGSLQHETIHGHPTRIRRLNAAIGGVPLSLWLPYAIYRRTHLAHHASPAITDPLADPESRYCHADSPVWQSLARTQATLAGRLAIGPLVAVAMLARDEWRRGRVAPRVVVRDWLPHLAAAAAVVAWLEWTGFGTLRYLLLVVYPGTALTLLRSFAEHRADFATPGRAATVRRGGPLALLFLNNNLHAAHHDRPALAWYRLPGHHRRNRARLEAGARAYRDYGEVVRRFALRPHDAILHPGTGRHR